MPIELRFVCAMLAAWRLTHLLTAEDGPGDVIVHLRARLGDSLAGRAMDCFYCLSIWIAAPLALFVVSTDVVSWGVTWLALSGAACLLERLTNRDALIGHPGGALTEVTRELSWTASPGTPLDTPSADVADAHIAGRIGSDPGRLPR